MLTTLQSILDAEQQAKTIIDDARAKAKKMLDDEGSGFELKIQEVEEQCKTDHERSGDDLKQKMKQQYADKISSYNSQADRINGINVGPKVDEVADLFLKQIS